jgi:hypothetical protein
MKDFWFWFFYVPLSLGILNDVLSGYCEIKRSFKGHGSSGIPIVSLITYWWVIIYCNKPIIHSRGVDLLLFTAFHVLCQYVLPYLVDKIFCLSKKRAFDD